MTAEPIPTIDQLDKTQWEPEAYDLLDHFVNFARMANAVNTEPGPLQGWFSEALWRHYSYAPFNARVMENYYSLAFFYGYQAPWNIYYRHPGVLERLELTLRYTFKLMAENGAIPEYAPADLDSPMLAPSSFGMEYMAAALDVAGDLLPEGLKQELITQASKAAVYVLTSDESWSHARSFTNQFLGAMAGGAKLARLTQDAYLKALVEGAGPALLADFMSPMGFLYERDGPETFAYFFVTLRRLIHLYHEWPDNRVLEVLRRHCAWMSRWMLLEPDGETIILAGSHQTRTVQNYRLLLPTQYGGDGGVHARPQTPRHHRGLGELLADALDERRFLKFFLVSREAEAALRQAWRVDEDIVAAARRRGLIGGYPPVSVLARYTPYAPPAAEIAAARKTLSYLNQTSFAETQSDERGNQYIFIRQPTYYTAFAFASHPSQARHGPAFLWHPQGGTVILSENGDGVCWETRRGEVGTAQALVLATVRDGRGGHEVIVRYEGGLTKTYVLRPEGIDVLLRAGSDQAVAERIPLLLREDDLLHLDYGSCPAVGLSNRMLGAVTQYLSLERAGKRLLHFDFGAQVPLSLVPTYDPDGFIRATLTFQPAAVYFGRTGYRLQINT